MKLALPRRFRASPISPEKYYRRASFAPLFIPLGLLPVVFEIFWLASLLPGGLAKVAMPIATGLVILVLGGMYGVIPFGLFLVLVWKFFLPRSESGYRRLSFLAPILVALPLVILGAILDWVSTGKPQTDGVYFFGTATLLFGYFYVLLVEGGLVVGKLLGLVGFKQGDASSGRS